MIFDTHMSVGWNFRQSLSICWYLIPSYSDTKNEKHIFANVFGNPVLIIRPIGTLNYVDLVNCTQPLSIWFCTSVESSEFCTCLIFIHHSYDGFFSEASWYRSVNSTQLFYKRSKWCYWLINEFVNERLTFYSHSFVKKKSYSFAFV